MEKLKEHFQGLRSKSKMQVETQISILNRKKNSWTKGSYPKIINKKLKLFIVLLLLCYTDLSVGIGSQVRLCVEESDSFDLKTFGYRESAMFTQAFIQ
uniref:Uncharacterized protein n=1 Tax=Nelumbo nucifera TaxID=4432 RepID=A0A822ZHP1_NELNU|nr:TPA_asm: hypothetical protein HUJ06_002892 [Nelumbo nucifera]